MGERERSLSTGSLLILPHQLVLDQAKARKLKLHLGFPCDWQEFMHMVIFHFFLDYQQGTGSERSFWDLYWYSYRMPLLQVATQPSVWYWSCLFIYLFNINTELERRTHRHTCRILESCFGCDKCGISKIMLF